MTEINLTGINPDHAVHAKALCNFGAVLGSRGAVSQIILGALEYALVELAAGFAAENARRAGLIALETSPAIAECELTEFALDKFERGLQGRLDAIAVARMQIR